MDASVDKKVDELNNAVNSILNAIEMEDERSYTTTAELFQDLFTTYSAISNAQNMPVTIESTYVGLRLGSYERSDFVKLVAAFASEEQLHAYYALKIVQDAESLLRQFSNIRVFEAKTEADDIIIVGDLHGNFRDLKHIIDKFGIPGDRYQFVFNGDYVDRGRQQTEVLLTVLYAFILFPNRVFLNRGNHEDCSMNVNPKFSPNFLEDVKNKFKQYSSVVFNAAERLFTHLPVATVVENAIGVRVFISHGGISDIVDLKFIQDTVKRHEFTKISTARRLKLEGEKAAAADQICDILWSDPIINDEKSKLRGAKHSHGCFANLYRGVGKLFGPDVSAKICRDYNFDFIVRSHECRENGYTHDHEHCYTIFSASHYCGRNNNAAVFLLVFDANSLAPYVFETKDRDDIPKITHLDVIEKFKILLLNPEYDLLKKFREVDVDKTGFLKTQEWAGIISHLFDTLEPGDIITIKDYLCVCEDGLDLVNYETMFTGLAKRLYNKDYYKQLKHLFNVMDINGDGKISFKEAKQAIDIMNETLGISDDISRQYVILLKKMDTNESNYIDFKQFEEAFLSQQELI